MNPQKLPLHIGRFGVAMATATKFAEKAITVAALTGRKTVALQMALDTGDIWVTPIDAPTTDKAFVRGIRHDSDPDILADDIRSEAEASGLINRRRVVPRVRWGKADREQVLRLRKAGYEYADISRLVGVSPGTACKWVKGHTR